MTDLTFSLGGDISAFERAMFRAGTLASKYSGAIEQYFTQASQRIDQQFGTSLTSALNLDRVLGGLKLAGGLLLGFEALKEVIDLTNEAAQAAAKDLQHLVDIGNKSRDAGVNATFFQGFTESVKKLGLDAAQAEAFLASARDALRDNIGEGDDAASSAAADRVKQNVMAGNLPAAAQKQLQDADTLEAKERVILDLIDQLQAKGAQLAAYDLAGKVFGSEFETNLRNGVDLVGTMRQALDGVTATSEGRIASEQEIATAQRIQAEYADQNQRIAAAWAPIEQMIATYQQDQLQSMADLREIYVAVAVAAGNIASAFARMGNYISQLGNASVFKQLDALMDKYGLLTGDFKRQYEQGHPDSAPDAAPPLTIRPKRDTSKSLPSLTPPRAPRAAPAQTDEVENLIKSLQKAAAAEQGEAAAVALGNKAKQESIDLAKAEEAARERGKPLSDAERAQVLALADSYATAKQKLDDFKEAQETLKKGMDDLREASKNALSTLVDDLRNGKGFGATFIDVLNSIESKLLDMAEDQAIAGLFGKTGSTTSTGVFGSLFSGVAGSVAVGGKGFQGWFGLADGGPVRAYAGGGRVSGPGGPRSDDVPAWLSAGEYVLPADVVKQHGSLIEALHAGKVARFADGGLVSRAVMPAGSRNMGGRSMGIDASTTYQIDARGAQMGAGDQIVAAIRAYDAQKSRTQFKDQLLARRGFG